MAQPIHMRARSFLIILLLAKLCASAAEPEKIGEDALRQIQALEQEKLSRSALHQKLDSQFVFRLKQKRGQLIAPGVTHLQADVKLEADGRILVDIESTVSESLLAQTSKTIGVEEAAR